MKKSNDNSILYDVAWCPQEARTPAAFPAPYSSAPARKHLSSPAPAPEKRSTGQASPHPPKPRHLQGEVQINSSVLLVEA
ncbi:hypothetical protein ZWY2020_053153 [Hordeum vulgare]|nr:hypothetical protein ZWY2020_053153 [Hordeum vulgare]